MNCNSNNTWTSARFAHWKKRPGHFVQWFVEDGEFELARRYGSGDTHFRVDLDSYDPSVILDIFKRFFRGDTSWHEQYVFAWEKGPEIGDPGVEYIDLDEEDMD